AWPTSARPLDEQLLADLSTHGRDALAAVADRRDLCLLLLEEEAVERGALSIPLNANSSARLVQALTLARHMGDGGLEKTVLDTLDRRRHRIDSNGNTYGEVVAYWAAVLRDYVPVAVDDVAANKAILEIRRRP